MSAKNYGGIKKLVALAGLILILIGASGIVTAQDSSDGKAIFDQKCAMCHSIGGGRGVGPDLLGVTENREHDWLLQIILDPDGLHASGDTIALELQDDFGMPMPSTGVSEADAESVLAYLAEAAAGPSEPAEETIPAETMESTGDPVLDEGMSLFNEKCSFCHTLGGGRTTGVDLIGVTRVREHEWLIKVLTDPSIYNMPMPNFDLETEQIEAIIAYIDSFEVPSEGGIGSSIGKPVPGTVIGDGEEDAVLDYIFGEDRADQPKTAALSQPSDWRHIPPIAKVLVITGAILFIIFLLGIALGAAMRKSPQQS